MGCFLCPLGYPEERTCGVLNGRAQAEPKVKCSGSSQLWAVLLSAAPRTFPRHLVFLLESVGSSIPVILLLLGCLEPTWGTISVHHRHKDVGYFHPLVSAVSSWLMWRLYKQASCWEEATATQLPMSFFINTKIDNGEKKPRNKQAGCF